MDTTHTCGVVFPSYFLIYFQALKAALVSSFAGRTTLEIFATIIVSSLVLINIQIPCGCILAIDLPKLMADPHLRMNLQETIAAKFSSPIPDTNTGSVLDMTSVLTKTLLSNAADIAPPIRRKKVPRGWCATE